MDEQAKEKSPAELRFDQGEWQGHASPDQPCFQVPFPQAPETYNLDLGGDPSSLTLVIASWDGDMHAVAPVVGGAKLEPARLDRIVAVLVGAALDEMYGVEFGTTEVDTIAALERRVDEAGDQFLTVPANATGGAMVARVRTHAAVEDLVVQLTLVRAEYAPFLPPLELSCGE